MTGRRELQVLWNTSVLKLSYEEYEEYESLSTEVFHTYEEYEEYESLSTEVFHSTCSSRLPVI